MWPFNRKSAPVEQRAASASGFTAEIIAARESYISGRRGIGELTATVQSCVSLWEGALSLADVNGTDLLDPRTLALIARSCAFRGEAVFLIADGGLKPVADWDLSTRDGEPAAYRLSMPDVGGGRTLTALAAEVLHIRIGSDVITPYYGQAPLRRASISAELLHAVEDALREVFQTAPLGSQIVPFPESDKLDTEKLGRDFRGQRGRVLLRESVNVTAAGGPTPQTDWRPADLGPNLQDSMALETLREARGSIALAFGVLPALLDKAAQGPMIREAQRHLAQYTLQPVAHLIAQECSEKLDLDVTMDVMRPLQAFDTSGRARAMTAIVKAMAEAKEAGVDLATALNLVDW